MYKALNLGDILVHKVGWHSFKEIGFHLSDTVTFYKK